MPEGLNGVAAFFISLYQSEFGIKQLLVLVLELYSKVGGPYSLTSAMILKTLANRPASPAILLALRVVQNTDRQKGIQTF